MEAGQDESRFWHLTLREIDTILKGALRRVEREHNDRAWLAWHVAFMSVYAPRKPRKFWKLQEMLVDRKPKRPMTPDEIAQAVKAWMGVGKR